VIRRIVVPGHPWQKVCETLISLKKKKKSCAWCHTPVIPVTLRSLKQEDLGPGWPRQKSRPYLQNNQRKKGWRHLEFKLQYLLKKSERQILILFFLYQIPVVHLTNIHNFIPMLLLIHN
jgi:hypothetical protein